MTELTNETYNDFIADGVVIVDIWSPTCAPCLQLMPIFQELASEMSENADFGKLNTADYRDTAVSLGIRTIPSLLFYKNGKLEAQTAGLQTKDNIKEILNSLLVKINN